MDGMALFLARRLVAVLVVSVSVSALAFIALHALVPEAFPDAGPLPAETARYLERAFLHFDLGESLKRPFGDVSDLVLRGLPTDVLLIGGGLVCGVVIGVLAGVVCAVRPGTMTAAFLHGLALLALCSPVYFIGLAIVLVFTPGIGAPLPFWLVSPNEYVRPSDDLVQWLDAILVPWLVTGAPLAGAALRTTEVNLKEVLRADYVRTAAAKGLRPVHVVLRHALPVALAPTLALTAAWVPLMVGNAILIERVFGLPGIYQLIPGALDLGNYPLVLGMVVVTTVLVVVVGGVVDLAQGLLDPRVRLRA